MTLGDIYENMALGDTNENVALDATKNENWGSLLEVRVKSHSLGVKTERSPTGYEGRRVSHRP